MQIPLISLAQIVTTAIAKGMSARDVEKDYTSRFNYCVSTVSDFMAMHNLTFANIVMYRATLDNLVRNGQLKNAVAEVFKTDGTPVDASHVLELVAKIYAMLTQNLRFMSEQAKMVVTARYAYEPIFSESRFSVHPTLSELSYVNNGMMNTDKVHGPEYALALTAPTKEQRSAMLRIARIFSEFNSLSRDPAYGNNAYGVLPYVFPAFDPDDLVPENFATTSTQYLLHLRYLPKVVQKIVEANTVISYYRTNVEEINNSIEQLELQLREQTEVVQDGVDADAAKIEDLTDRLESQKRKLAHEEETVNRKSNEIHEGIDTLTKLIEQLLVALVEDYSNVVPHLPEPDAEDVDQTLPYA